MSGGGGGGGGCVSFFRQDHSEYLFKKRGGGGAGKYPCAYRAARVPLYTGGVHEPALGPLPGAQGAEPPEALEFWANKGLRFDRQQWWKLIFPLKFLTEPLSEVDGAESPVFQGQLIAWPFFVDNNT